MRSDNRGDQAEGLRRLLVCNQTRVVTVVSGKAGVGRTSATINLAYALAHSGKNVLVLDENPAPNNLTNHLGLFEKYDLLDVVQRRCKLREAILTDKGFYILSAARVLVRGGINRMGEKTQKSGSGFDTLRHDEHQRLKNALTAASDGMDVMLIDAAPPAQTTTPPMSLVNGAAALLVVEATPSGITESYALIKRLATENIRQQFEIVVNKVGNEKAAMTVFENMARVTRRNLSAHLEYLGFIPFDDSVNCAARLKKSVIEAFPGAVSAKSYQKLSQKLLCLSMQPDEVENGVSDIMQNLMKQVSQPPATLAEFHEAFSANV